MKISDLEATKRHIDSSAIDHVVHSTGVLQNMVSYNGKDFIMVGNGKYLTITHKGNGFLIGENNVPHRDVLVVPSIQRNLLSVSRLTSQFPCYVKFERDKFYISRI